MGSVKYSYIFITPGYTLTQSDSTSRVSSMGQIDLFKSCIW